MPPSPPIRPGLLPRVTKAGFLLSRAEASLRGRRARHAGRSRAARGAGRERSRTRAPPCRRARRCGDDWAGAGADWKRVLVAHPRDALALQWALLFDFYRGDARSPLREPRSARAATSGAPPTTLFPYVLGLHAFGLEESNLYGAAEEAGRRVDRHGAGAVGDPRRGSRHGDAGPPRRRGSAMAGPMAAALGRKATASPAASAGTRRLFALETLDP